MISKLLPVFSNYTRSLEILYLLEDVKDAVRLDANDPELSKIKNFCADENLFLEVSDFKLVKVADKGKGSYSNVVRKVPLDFEGDALYHLYVSKDGNKARFLKMVEEKNDDRAVGELLGYPKCCVDFFIGNKERQQKLQNDYILPALSNSEGFKFPYLANYALRYFDIALLSHFPHSFNCEESIKIAEKNLKIIEKHDEKLAEKFVDELKAAVLYTEHDGIFAFNSYKLNDGILSFEKINSTVKNNLFERLKNAKKLEIIDKNRVKIDEEILEDVGFMIFT